MNSVKTTLFFFFLSLTFQLFAQVGKPPQDSIIRKTKEEKEIMVSVGRHEQRLEEIPVSIEVIKPSLIQNKGLSNLEQVVNQSPGVFTMDGQVSIRGGGGYAYGAGSRVLLVWNGVPMLSPDVGDVKWNAVPMEHAEQIEIIKGASSVLYGSGALNGIISLNEKEAPIGGTFNAKVQSGVYMNPARESLKWWERPPTYQLADVYFANRIGRQSFTIGINGFANKGYREGNDEQRVRIHGTYAYYSKKYPSLKMGFSTHYQYQDMGVFILWRNDSMCYQALENTLSRQRAIRGSFNPYLKWVDPKKNVHSLKTRYYVTTTGNTDKVYDASFAQLYYADYQFLKKRKAYTLTLGTTSNLNQVTSYVFGNHISKNFSLYNQWEWHQNKFDLTAGIRIEYCRLDHAQPETQLLVLNHVSPIYPIARIGAHYALSKTSHLRASLGQGIRFPAVAERYVSASVGGVRIFQNPNLRPETGWAGELGWKQFVPIGNWKGILDIAGFINQYKNMTEFTFGIYKPDTMVTMQTIDPNLSNYLFNWVGFQAQNAERARITGVEFSFSSSGKIGQVEVLSLIGYTYMNPISLNMNPIYRATFSDTTTNMLKYRFHHLAKADIQLNYKKWGVGASLRYNSYMKNIDLAFEKGVLGQELLVGMDNYRALHHTGVAVVDLRLSYLIEARIRCNMVLNNVANAEYVSRPGDVQAPRNFMIQFQYNL
ncbi:MAG: hypothetical protein RLZZ301_1626 [Bacteroidota bacterium]|jgi:iron complex outermembrane receptor protein